MHFILSNKETGEANFREHKSLGATFIRTKWRAINWTCLYRTSVAIKLPETLRCLFAAVKVEDKFVSLQFAMFVEHLRLFRELLEETSISF